MFQYVALVWDPNSSAQCDIVRGYAAAFNHSTRGWELATACEGLQVFCLRKARSHEWLPVMPGNSSGAGVVVGTVFTRTGTDGWSRKTSFSALESQRILESRGKELVDSYWGAYVAFLCDNEHGWKRVIRDPAGNLDCLMTTTRKNVHIFFDSLQNCSILNELPFSINWDYVATSISFSVPDCRETGLKEIKRLIAGECLDIRPHDCSKSFIWHPFDFIESRRFTSAKRAAVEMRDAVRVSVHAWASAHDVILMSLSGGLDSSIVVGCLRDAPNRPRIVAANTYYSRAANGDERGYARLAARKAGCELFELELNPRFDLASAHLDRLPMDHSPGDSISCWALRPQLMRLVRQHRATAVFSGNGGDQMFLQAGPMAALVDYVFLRGFGKEIFSLLLYAARIQNTSVWAALWRSIVDGLLRDPRKSVGSMFRPPALIATDVAKAIEKNKLFLHPWLARRGRIAPGKLAQITTLGVLQTAARLEDPDEPEWIDPLYSQPLMELCLSIPTYVLAADGWDRVVARRAFTREVPSEILWRRQKCVVDQLTTHFVAHNMAYIRELLLDGELVRQRIVNRKILEDGLQSGLTKGVHFIDVCQLASIEVWHASWRRAQVTAAAA